jgi:signal transduction histidine kinase/DNA-binding NarL/FixJ family response regulator
MLNAERSSLNQKLTIIWSLSTGAACLFLLIAFAMTAARHHRMDQAEQLSAFAGVIGATSVEALMLNDQNAARNTLAALKATQDIASALLFDRNGKVFARYVAAGRTAPQLDLVEPVRMGEQALSEANTQGSAFWRSHMRLYRPVIGNHGQVGIVMLDADLSTMWRDIAGSLAAIAAAMGVSLVVALMLARRCKRRIAAAECSHHRDELERQVGVRTAQLEAAKNAAEAASLAKSALLATMSHEIRTPMNGVLGMTEMLLGTTLSETQRKITKLVKRSGEHLLVMVNDMLDFSKIEAGKLSIEQIPFRLHDVLDELDGVYRPLAHAKGIALEIDIANRLPPSLCGDPHRLRQILANLLDNAIKFTDQGSIHAMVQLIGEDRQCVALRFEVRDTGIGVPGEARDRIFEAFSQADRSTTRKYGGTGLGLAISQQLAGLMGGKIGVDNAAPQGSLFWFTVSLDKCGAGCDQAAAPLSAIEGRRAPIARHPRDAALHGDRVSSSAGNGRRKVLLAEDDPVSAEVATAMLNSLGVDVDCARNGEQALQAVRAVRYDAVLMDCHMPIMDGFAATAEIRRHEGEVGGARSLPIIAITANALQGDREACLAAGMDDYLSKPFTLAQLCAVLGRSGALAPACTVRHRLQRARLPSVALAPDHAEVINRHALDGIRALSSERGSALVQRVISAYVGDTAQHLETLRAAIAGLDTGNLRKVAHRLKSSSANVGADHLALMCKDMEHLGRIDSTQGASGILTDMEHEFQAVRHSLNAILEKET